MTLASPDGTDHSARSLLWHPASLCLGPDKHGEDLNMTEFTFHAKGDTHHERPRKRAAFHQRVQFKLERAQGPVQLRRDGGPPGPDRTTAEIMGRVRAWTKQARVGSRLDIITQDPGVVFNLRTVEVAPPVPAPDIAPALRPVYIRGFTRHQFLTNLGNWYCRFVAGTRVVSRHGYHAADDSWYGAAQDFGADNGDQLVQWANEIVAGATDPQDTEFYNRIATVIVHDRIWEQGVGWGHYGGEYHYHVHVDVDQGIACSP